MAEDRRELPEETHREIVAHSARGEEMFDAGEFAEAIGEFTKAWRLVSEPKTDWNAATWILTAIADAYFCGGDMERARTALDDAMLCPGAFNNPFLHMRRGQVLFEQGELDAAADELLRAHWSDGESELAKDGGSVFADEDPKYLTFLRSRAKDL